MSLIHHHQGRISGVVRHRLPAFAPQLYGLPQPHSQMEKTMGFPFIAFFCHSCGRVFQCFAHADILIHLAVGVACDRIEKFYDVSSLFQAHDDLETRGDVWSFCGGNRISYSSPSLIFAIRYFSYAPFFLMFIVSTYSPSSSTSMLLYVIAP